jgi:hypothetical protein
MRNLTWKDLVIVSLFFLLILVITPLFGLVDETPLESTLPVAMSVLGGYGFLLVLPIIFITSVFGLSGRANLSVAPWIAAIVYSSLLALVLIKSNRGKK